MKLIYDILYDNKYIYISIIYLLPIKMPPSPFHPLQEIERIQSIMRECMDRLHHLEEYIRAHKLSNEDDAFPATTKILTPFAWEQR